MSQPGRRKGRQQLTEADAARKWQVAAGSGADTYIGMMDANTEAIVAGLSHRAAPWSTARPGCGPPSTRRMLLRTLCGLRRLWSEVRAGHTGCSVG